MLDNISAKIELNLINYMTSANHLASYTSSENAILFYL